MITRNLAHVGDHNHEYNGQGWLNEEVIPGMKKTFTASEIIVHPKFDFDTLAYDVAILKERFASPTLVIIVLL